MIDSAAPSLRESPTPSVDDLMADLGRPYSLTGGDWVLSVSHTLTEPTRPTAWVHPESLPNFGLFRCDADTIADAIRGAVPKTPDPESQQETLKR